MKKSQKSFTLIELLIVISIIGILTSVVISATTLARGKARDTKRIGDMKEIQLGLAIYYNVNKTYPASLSTLIDPTQKYLAEIPTDPLGGASYEYFVTNGKYCLGVTLEDVTAIPSDNVSCTSASSGSTANYKTQPPQ